MYLKVSKGPSGQSYALLNDPCKSSGPWGLLFSNTWLIANALQNRPNLNSFGCGQELRILETCSLKCTHSGLVARSYSVYSVVLTFGFARTLYSKMFLLALNIQVPDRSKSDKL